jgi:hypothetical protein
MTAEPPEANTKYCNFSSHAYQFVESLPTEEPDVYKDLYACIHCGDLYVMTHRVGTRD